MLTERKLKSGGAWVDLLDPSDEERAQVEKAHGVRVPRLLAEARERAEESRRAIETTRAYLESILGNLSAGVLAFDGDRR